MLLLSDKDLIQHFQDKGTPLPFSLSALRKDRFTGQLGNVTYHRCGGKCLYNPDEVLVWLQNIPIGRAIIKPNIALSRVSKGRTGRPTKLESIEAQKRGLSVPALRAQQNLQIGGAA